MTKATSVHSTPRSTAPATRRQFSSWLMAATASAGAATTGAAMLPVVPAIAAAGKALDGTAVSQELRDLVAVLRAADDALKAAEAAFDGKYEAYRRFERENPQPSNGFDRRAGRRWDGKFKRWERENGYFAAQSAQVAAWRAFDNARRAIAEYRARDMNELAHMGCLAYVFEGKRRCSDHILSAGVALDVALMGTAGRFAA